MRSYKPEIVPQAVPRLLRQVEEEEEKKKEAEAQGLVSRQYDPLAQPLGQTGSEARVSAQIGALQRVVTNRPSEAAGSMQRIQRTHGNRYAQTLAARLAQDTEATEVAPEIENAIQTARGGGQALDSGVRAQMEPAFGANFSGVRIHTDGQADMLNRNLRARAFTTGQDIFFKQGEYSPSCSSGREILVHELTHVVQQAEGIQPKLVVNSPGDRYEHEAETTARTFARMQPEYNGVSKQQLQLVNEGGGPSLYVSYNVPLIPQTSNMSCWAASAAMLVAWRNGIPIDDQTIASGIGYWTEYLHGLDPENVHMFMSWGLTEEQPQTFTVEGFANLLSMHGPLWVAADANSAAGVAPHVRVVTGIYGDGTVDGTYLAINDPGGPQTVVETYATFLGAQEQLAEAELPHFHRPIYVAHCQ